MPSAMTRASDPDRVEAVTRVQRRCRWPLSEKLRAIEEASPPRWPGSRPRRRSAYHKANDAWLLSMIRSLVDERPKYGYRRVGALLNRQMAALGKPPVKCEYRLMRQNGLLLARHIGTGRQRLHDGVVRTLRSNLRWCSDVFDVPCWNGETVRVAFVLGTCDRDVITWPPPLMGSRFSPCLLV